MLGFKKKFKMSKRGTGYIPISDNTQLILQSRLSKRCYGMDCITTKLEETQLTSIVLSVFVMNLFKIQKRIRYALLYLSLKRDKYKYWNLQISA